jgi:hypothetical protein
MPLKKLVMRPTPAVAYVLLSEAQPLSHLSHVFLAEIRAAAESGS